MTELDIFYQGIKYRDEYLRTYGEHIHINNRPEYKLPEEIKSGANKEEYLRICMEKVDSILDKLEIVKNYLVQLKDHTHG